MSELDLNAILEFAVLLAKQAGAAIVEGSENRFKSAAGYDEKKNSVDLVTETDQAVEKMVKNAIFEAFPTHKFVGEESWAAGEKNQITDDPTWICDPIDGTTNFIHGFPWVAISLGFTYKKKPVLGVIYAPFIDHLYTGVAGQGSFVRTPQNPDPRRLPLVQPAPPLSSLGSALVGLEWGSDRRKDIMDKKARSFERLAGDGREEAGAQKVVGGLMCQGIRSIGSAALHYCHVAAGQEDMYWEIGCWAWDVCAGIVIAQEAGAIVVGSKAHTESVSPDELGEVTVEILTGRRYLVVRGIGEKGSAEGRKAQEKIVKEFYSAVEEWEAV